MRTQGQLILALGLVFVGAIFLAGNLFGFDTAVLCWPLALILAGVFVIVRPRIVPAGTAVEMKLLGDTVRRGMWDVTSQEIWSGVGKVTLDFSQASIPPGVTRLRVIGFIGDVRVNIPATAGIAISTAAFINKALILGEKRENFLSPVEWSSPRYEAAERKVFIEMLFFIVDLNVGGDR